MPPLAIRSGKLRRTANLPVILILTTKAHSIKNWHAVK